MPNDAMPSNTNEGASKPPPSDRIGLPIRPSNPDPSRRRDWAVPWILSLALHGAALVLVLWLRVPEAAPVPEPEIVHLVLGPEASSAEATRAFRELPADRADAQSPKSDLLSNVASRARDLETGGESELPRMRGESDGTLVELKPGAGATQPATVTDSRSTTPEASRTELTRAKDAREEDASSLERADAPLPDRSAPASPPAATGATIRVTPGTEGDADFRQPESDYPGNAGLTGDISLSTMAWEYAPWMERFSRRLMRHWFAPPAYGLGVLKEGGWCVLRVEISRSGQILHLGIEEQHGHVSLTEAAESAVRSLAPLEPLPAEFPEETLLMRLRMIYPRIRRR